MRTKGHFSVYRRFIASDRFRKLKDTDKVLLLHLWSEAVPLGPERGTLRKSQAKIAADIGKKRDTIRTSLGRLEDAELIQCEVVPGGSTVIRIPKFDEHRNLTPKGGRSPDPVGGQVEDDDQHRPDPEQGQVDEPKPDPLEGQVDADEPDPLEGQGVTPKGVRGCPRRGSGGDPVGGQVAYKGRARVETKETVETCETAPGSEQPTPLTTGLAPHKTRGGTTRDAAFRLIALQAELRDALLGPGDRATSQAPGMATPIAPLLREGFSEAELEHALRVTAAEARGSGSLRWFNGETNWRDGHVRRCLATTPEQAEREAREKRNASGQSNQPNAITDEALYEVDLSQ